MSISSEVKVVEGRAVLFLSGTADAYSSYNFINDRDSLPPVVDISGVANWNFRTILQLVEAFGSSEEPCILESVPIHVLDTWHLFENLKYLARVASALVDVHCAECDVESRFKVTCREDIFRPYRCTQCDNLVEIDRSEAATLLKHLGALSLEEEKISSEKVLIKERRLRVLVAEDDRDDREMLSESWQELGLKDSLEFVHNGQELLDVLHRDLSESDSSLPDLILLDLNMPKMDGREALERIRSDSRFTIIPIVVLTTSSAEADLVSSYKSGANTYLRKPESYSKLVDLLWGLSNYWLGLVPVAATSKT